MTDTQPAYAITTNCHNCQQPLTVERSDVAFWPDHLWPGAVSALGRCKCGTWVSLGWAHDLPIDWQQDVPCKNWLQYHLPRLIFSCHHHGIPADLLPEFAKIPFFGLGRHCVPRQVYEFDAREGYRKKIGLLKTLITAAQMWFRG